MSRSQKEMIVVLGLLVVLGGLIIWRWPSLQPAFVKTGPRMVQERRETLPTPQLRTMAAPSSFENLDGLVFSEHDTKSEQAWGRDPFMNVLGLTPRAPEEILEYLLTGVSFRGSLAYAILDDAIVTIGSEVDDYFVKEIGRKYIILEKESDRYMIRMQADEW